MNFIATIRRLGIDVEVEFYEAGNDHDARRKALDIATAYRGVLIGIRRA